MKIFQKKKIFFIFTLLIFSLSFYLKAKEQDQVKIHRVSRVATFSIDSSINPSTYSYLKSGFQRINKGQEDADLILIKTNTPGGLVSTTKNILTLFGQSDLPIIIWVTPEGASATSAGAIISSGAHFLFMSPGTNIGAATPITITEGDRKVTDSPLNFEKKNKEENQTKNNIKTSIKNDPKMKAINDLTALVRGLSEIRGRNGKKFEQMISLASSFSATEAFNENIINNLANDQNDILKFLQDKIVKIKGKSYKIQIDHNSTFNEIEMDIGQKILNIFANPALTYILFIIGAALLYLEMQAPGGLIAGSIGAVFLVLSGIGFQVLPLNFGALGLIILSFVLFVLEVYVTSYGILSLAGLLSLFFGSSFLYRSADSYLTFESSIIYSTMSGIILFLLLIGYLIYKDWRNAKGKNAPFDMRGKKAIISSFLHQSTDGPIYHVHFNGEIWKAICPNGQSFATTDEVTVQSIDDEKLLLIISK